MSSVTKRISMVKQPRGGYLKPSSFQAVVLDDGLTLNPEENVSGTIIGMAVDYLTRFAKGADKAEAFMISMAGASIAESVGFKNATSAAVHLLSGINGLDKGSIINACKLVTFDVWKRNVFGAINAADHREIEPDSETIENIQIMVNRSVRFFEQYGPVVKEGFTFEPEEENDEDRILFITQGKGTYGGYTSTVSSGDGDFLTRDTIWDFKVSKQKPQSRNTLQLLMYWIMGRHSGQVVFQSITKLGFFNPRLNSVFLLETKDIPTNVIETVEKEVICYE